MRQVKGRQMARAVGRAVEDQQAAAFERAVDDRFGEIVIVQYSAPGGERRLVGREDHRPLLEMAVVDDVEEHVRSIGAIGY